ncbi:MAG: hypothetical protein NVSMB53_05860 [Gemmatimonadaceae bacterium]
MTAGSNGKGVASPLDDCWPNAGEGRAAKPPARVRAEKKAAKGNRIPDLITVS